MRKYATTAAVMAGSLILFVPLSLVALASGFGTLRGALGLESIGSGGALGLLVALAFAYVTAMEIARIELHGFEELHRGTRVRRLARHGVLATVTAAAGVALVELLVSGVVVGIETGQTVVAIGSVASLVALAWVAVRSMRAFGGGVQRSAQPQ